jgi:hypothetical protein
VIITPIQWSSIVYPKKEQPLIPRVERITPLKWPDKALKRLLQDIKKEK